MKRNTCNKILMLAVAALAAMAVSSCVKNRFNTSAPDDRITFQVATHASTKAVQGEKFDYSSFGVFAFGDRFENGLFLYNREVYRNQYWDSNTQSNRSRYCLSSDVYWPKFTALDFVAYYPRSNYYPNVEYSSEYGSMNIKRDTVKCSGYVCRDGYQRDLMISSKAAGYTGNVDELTDDVISAIDSRYNGVPILFHHLLSKVGFSIVSDKLKSDDGVFTWAVTVNNFKIVDVYTKADLTLVSSDPDATGLVDWTYPETRVWSNPSAPSTLFNRYIYKSVSEEGTSYTLCDPMYVIPQVLDGTQYAVLDISIYTYKNGNSILIEQKTMEIPLATPTMDSWKINQAVNYVIKFTPFYSEDGESPVRIDLDPVVVGWDEFTAATQPEKKVIDPLRAIFYSTSDGKPIEITQFTWDYYQRAIYGHILSNSWNDEMGMFAIVLDDELENIGTDYMFDGCGTLTDVILPDNLTRIGRFAFRSTRLKAVRIPPDVHEIAESAYTYITPDTLILPKGKVIQCGHACFGHWSIDFPLVLSSTLKGGQAFNNTFRCDEIRVTSDVTEFNCGMFYFSLYSNVPHEMRVYFESEVPPAFTGYSRFPLGQGWSNEMPTTYFYVPRGSKSSYVSAYGGYSNYIFEYDK